MSTLALINANMNTFLSATKWTSFVGLFSWLTFCSLPSYDDYYVTHNREVNL